MPLDDYPKEYMSIGSPGCDDYATTWECFAGDQPPDNGHDIFRLSNGLLSTAPLHEIVAARKSTRSGGPITTEHLGGVLHLAGSNAPSAGNFRTIRAVVAAGSVEGLGCGLWLYDPRKHCDSLLHRIGGTDDADAALSAAAGAMRADTVPPAVILLKALDADPLCNKYGANAFALSTREAGVWLGLLSLAVVAAGIGGCCLGPAAWNGGECKAAFALWG